MAAHTLTEAVSALLVEWANQPGRLASANFELYLLFHIGMIGGMGAAECLSRLGNGIMLNFKDDLAKENTEARQDRKVAAAAEQYQKALAAVGKARTSLQEHLNQSRVVAL
jgi:hypothetical protein